MILEAIPFDDWISPAKLAEKTGMSPQVVGIIISNSLIPVLVEKMDLGVPKIGTRARALMGISTCCSPGSLGRSQVDYL